MSEVDEAPGRSDADELQADLDRFQHDLAELRRASDLSFEVMGRRIAGDPDVMGSGTSFHTLLSAPLLRPPRRKMLLGFLRALELPDDAMVEWERRRQDLADRWERASFPRKETESPAAPVPIRRRRRPLVLVGLGVTVLLVVLASVALWGHLMPAAESGRRLTGDGAEALSRITGEVRCVSGSTPMGVFIAIRNSPDSKFADWKADSADPSRGSYSSVVPVGARYALHVGCGQGEDGWLTDNWSPEVGGEHHVVVCDDRLPLQRGEHFGTCTAE